MIPLDVARWTQRQCTNSAGTHSVVVLFMRLDVLAELVLAVANVIDLASVDNLARAGRFGHAPWIREAVQPEHDIFDEFNHDATRESCEGEGVVNASRSLLGGSVVPLHVANVFIVGGDVQVDVHVSQLSPMD